MRLTCGRRRARAGERPHRSDGVPTGGVGRSSCRPASSDSKDGSSTPGRSTGRCAWPGARSARESPLGATVREDVASVAIHAQVATRDLRGGAQTPPLTGQAGKPRARRPGGCSAPPTSTLAGRSRRRGSRSGVTPYKGDVEWDGLGRTQRSTAPVLLPYEPETSSREKYVGPLPNIRQLLIVVCIHRKIRGLPTWPRGDS